MSKLSSINSRTDVAVILPHKARALFHVGSLQITHLGARWSLEDSRQL